MLDNKIAQLGLQNLDLLSLSVAISAIGILGFAIYYSDREKRINRAFFEMSVCGITWGIFNYLGYQFSDSSAVLWLFRLALFFATWFSFFIFELLYSFGQPAQKNNAAGIKSFFWVTMVVSIINLTPLVFQKVGGFNASGRVSEIVNGPGIYLFGLTVIFLIGSGIASLLGKISHSEGEDKLQKQLILYGLGVTSLLLIVFNFIFPALLKNPDYIPLGGVFLFPFIALTSYAIIRHRLFGIKVIATEIFTFILAIVSMVEVITSQDKFLIFFRLAIFLLVLGFGFMLIKSVRKEVQQRMELEKLSSELADANTKLTALDQARAEFISIASHQLRTPPATVKWYLGAILAGDYGELMPETKQALEKTFRTNNSLISLIDDMLNVSRIERGKMEFLFENTDLLPLAKTTYEQLEPIAKEKGLRLQLHAPKEPLQQIMADGEKIRQVMNNLLDNAIKYTKRGEIVVSLKQENEEILFAVADTGKGIGQEEQRQIFQKYSRGKESLKQSAGLGLGLYVAKVIIEQHKGRIWAESKGEGHGAVFSFALPLRNDLTRTTLLDLAESQPASKKEAAHVIINKRT